MLTNVENIYLSKLTQLKSVIETNASKSSGASVAFADLLSSVEQRINSTTSESSVNLYAVEQQTGVQTNTEYPNTTVEVNAAIENAARNTGLDSDLIRAVIQTESSFRVNAVSSCGAQGLMQLMPGTARELGVNDPFDPFQNVNGGATYLKKQIERFGDVRLALAAYNTGPSRIAKLGITDADDPEQYERIASGVRGYVAKVMKYYNQYSQR